MATAFSIVGDLLLKTGSFVTDTARAEKSMRSLKRETLDMFAVFKGSFASSALTELISQLSRVPGAINDVIREAGNFQDVGERIGAAAEDVAGLQLALATTGTSVDDFATFSAKLTKNLSQIDDESKGAGKAIQALGLDFQAFKAADPVTQVEQLAKALKTFQNGPEQTAVLEALVKGGSRLLSFLKELEATGGRQNVLTKEQLRLADELSDRQARQAAAFKQTAQVILLEMAPSFVDLTKAAREAVSEMLGIETVGGRLAASNKASEFADRAADSLASLADFAKGVAQLFIEIGLAYGATAAAIAAAAKLNFGEARTILAEVRADIAALNKPTESFVDRLGRIRQERKQETAQRRVEDRGFDPRPKLDTSGLVKPDTDNKDDPAKRLLENQLKALDRVIKHEQELITDRNRALDGLNALSLQSFQAYYDAQIAIIEAGGSAQIAAIDKQIAAVNAARSKPGVTQKDAAELEGKLADLTDKRAQVQIDADRKIIEASQKKRDAEKQYQDTIKGTAAAVLELQGNLAAAAAIRFDLQNADLLKRAIAEADTNTQSLLATLRQAAIVQAEFATASAEAQRSLDALGNREQRIDIARTGGQINEIQRLAQIRDARAAQIPAIEANVEALERLARAPGATPALVQQADQARLALERLKATADPLADTFRGIFEDAGATGIEAFINDIRHGENALKAFANSVEQQITRLVSQNLSQSLFGQNGAFGGLSTFASTIFGGQGGAGGAGGAAGAAGAVGGAASTTAAATATTALATSATAAAPALTAVTTASTAVSAGFTAATAPMAALAAAAEAATAALAQLAASETASAAADFIDFGAFFAEGGAPPVGKAAVGGERGRELFVQGARSQEQATRSIQQMVRPATFPRTKTPAETSAALQSLVSNQTTISGATIIGENGPQIFRPTVPGYVIPADETEALLRRFPDFGGFFAGGGSTPTGRRSMGGERGRELFMPITAGKTLNTSDSRSSSTTNAPVINQQFTVSGPVDRRTEQQIANAAGQGVQRAMARNS